MMTPTIGTEGEGKGIGQAGFKGIRKSLAFWEPLDGHGGKKHVSLLF
jgi:hypothetical protein